METTTDTPALALRAGDAFSYRDTIVTVLRDSETQTDRFGRTLVAYWCSRADTGAEGFVSFGSGCTLTFDVVRA